MTRQRDEGVEYFAERFGVTAELLERLVAAGLDGGGDHAEVFLQHRTSQTVTYEDGKVSAADVRVDLGAGLRVLSGDRTGYAYTEELAPERMLEAARTAASIAATAPSARPLPFRITPVAGGLYPTVRAWDAVAPAAAIDLVRRLGDGVARGDPAVVKTTARLASADESFLVATSDGVLVGESRPMTYAVASCVAERGGRRESSTFSRSGRRGLDLYTEALIGEIAAEAVRRTLFLFDAGPPPAGEMPVVLAPATSGILLHEAMGHGFEADFNRKGRSIFSTKMGQRICPDFVTIVDSALEPGDRGSIHVDDEGTPGQQTLLVDRGRLVSYLHDRLSAAHYGVSPTGNGRRQDFRHPPLPRMRVTFMESGPHDPEEIVRSVKRGLYVSDFGNGEVAIGAGDYSFYVKAGHLIEDGKLTRPIKDANLIGNGPDSLSKVEMVGADSSLDHGTWTCGKDGQMVPVGMGLPTVLVSSITVGGVNR
jgi:TldD protein